MTNSRENLSRPGIIDARLQYQAAARRLRNTALEDPACEVHSTFFPLQA